MTPHSPILDFSFTVWREDGEIRIHDAYKWLIHATLGGEHAVKNDKAPRKWLDNEWPTLTEPFEGEPLIAKLRPDGKLIRVNLRPYREQGGDKEAILQTFVQSARLFHADRMDFVQEWLQLGAYLNENGPWQHLSYADWQMLDGETNDQDYPAIDHSSEYTAVKKPAYRVMLAELWP